MRAENFTRGVFDTVELSDIAAWHYANSITNMRAFGMVKVALAAIALL